MSMENAAEERLRELTVQIEDVKKMMKCYYRTDPVWMSLKETLITLGRERNSLVDRLAWKVAI